MLRFFPIVAYRTRLEGRDSGSAISDGAPIRAEYGGICAARQQSFQHLLLVLLLVAPLVFLLELRSRSVPVAVLASFVPSRSEVVVAMLIRGAAFTICSVTGWMVLIGIWPTTDSAEGPTRSFAVERSLQGKTGSRLQPEEDGCARW